MKFVILILVIGVVLMLLSAKKRSPQVKARTDKEPSPAASSAATAMMVSCAHCGLHLPRAEALPGRGGDFCSADHRSQFEARHPQP